MLSIEKRDYEGFEGFGTRPMSWQAAAKKFEYLAQPHVTPTIRGETVDAISRLDSIQVAEFTRLLAAAGEVEAKHA